MLFTSFVSVPFTFALFVIVASYVFSGKLFTLTSNVILAVPEFTPSSVSSAFGTCTFIPFFRSSSVYVLTAPFSLTLPFTNDVPSGITSFNKAVPSVNPSFVKVIVYVIISPSNT